MNTYKQTEYKVWCTYAKTMDKETLMSFRFVSAFTPIVHRLSNDYQIHIDCIMNIRNGASCSKKKFIYSKSMWFSVFLDWVKYPINIS